jgi:hypothetical protein
VTTLADKAMRLLGTMPLYLSRENAAAATGQPWRWVRDTARMLKVNTITIRRKTLIPASAFVDALQAAGGGKHDIPAPASAQSLETPDAVLAALGKRRKGGA